MRQRKILIWAGLLLSLIISGPASAALIFTSLGGNQYSISFDPLTFTATGDSIAAGSVHEIGVVFENFFATNLNTADGTHAPSSFSGSITVNGGSSQTFTPANGQGILSVTANAIDPNDLFVYGSIPSPGFLTGNSVTIAISDLVFTAASVPAALTSGSVDAYLFTRRGAIEG